MGKTAKKHSWFRSPEMYMGPDLRGEGKTNRMNANKGRLTDPVFIKACELAEIPVSKRQASKFNNGYGAAYNQRFNARKEVTNA